MDTQARMYTATLPFRIEGRQGGAPTTGAALAGGSRHHTRLAPRSIHRTPWTVYAHARIMGWHLQQSPQKYTIPCQNGASWGLSEAGLMT